MKHVFLKGRDFGCCSCGSRREQEEENGRRWRSCCGCCCCCRGGGGGGRRHHLRRLPNLVVVLVIVSFFLKILSFEELCRGLFCIFSCGDIAIDLEQVQKTTFALYTRLRLKNRGSTWVHINPVVYHLPSGNLT